MRSCPRVNRASGDTRKNEDDDANGEQNDYGIEQADGNESLHAVPQRLESDQNRALDRGGVDTNL